MTATDTHVLACGVLLAPRNDNSNTIAAAWLFEFAAQSGMDPGNVPALIESAKRQVDSMSIQYRAQCETHARAAIDLIIHAKIEMAQMRARGQIAAVTSG